MGQTDLLRDAKREMDEMLAGVMPETWLGHARLAIYESDVTGKQEEFALKLAHRVAENTEETIRAEVFSKKALKETRERFA